MTYATRGHRTGLPTYRANTGTGSKARRWSHSAIAGGTGLPPDAQARPCDALRPARRASAAQVKPDAAKATAKSAGVIGGWLPFVVALGWIGSGGLHQPSFRAFGIVSTERRQRAEPKLPIFRRFPTASLRCLAGALHGSHGEVGDCVAHGRISSVIGAAVMTAPGVGLGAFLGVSHGGENRAPIGAGANLDGCAAYAVGAARRGGEKLAPCGAAFRAGVGLMRAKGRGPCVAHLRGSFSGWANPLPIRKVYATPIHRATTKAHNSDHGMFHKQGEPPRRVRVQAPQ